MTDCVHGISFTENCPECKRSQRERKFRSYEISFTQRELEYLEIIMEAASDTLYNTDGADIGVSDAKLSKAQKFFSDTLPERIAQCREHLT